ncbi:MAG: BMP family ABC transporter substrate-binding protein [Chloroflexota bacterium]
MLKWKAVYAFICVIALILPGCTSKVADCQQPEVFCVGLVTEVGRRDDRSYNQAAWEGVEQSKTAGVADWTASIETVDARDYEENIRVFAEAGYDVIVTVGGAMSDVTRVMSRTYPDSYFIGVDQDQSGNQEFSTNLTGLIFPEDQIGYLAGALAASLSQTGQIGAVCGSDGSLAIQRYGYGYRAGAAYVNPDVKVTVIYHNDVGLDKTFNDPEWGAATANSLIDAGTDIVFGVGGKTGSNALAAAAMRGAYAIGVDTDEYYTLPVAAPHIYASVMKLITLDIAELIKITKDAQARISAFPTGNYLGQVGLSPYHDLDSSIPDEVKTRMNELVLALRSGEIQTGVSINP